MIVLIIYIQRNKKSKPVLPVIQPDQERVEVPEKRNKPQALFNVTEQYKAIAHDEIDLNVGDLVNVSKVFGDGWGKGNVLNTNRNGVFPMYVLQYQQ